jgi:hypothetical protein
MRLPHFSVELWSHNTSGTLLTVSNNLHEARDGLRGPSLQGSKQGGTREKDSNTGMMSNMG